MSLTHKQETFCQGIIDGLTQSDAYRQAYDAENMSDSVVYVKSSELMRDGNITVRIAELREQLDELNIWPRKDRLKMFEEIGNNPANKPLERLAAAKAYSEAVGDNATQKLDIKHDNISIVERIIVKTKDSNG